MSTPNLATETRENLQQAAQEYAEAKRRVAEATSVLEKRDKALEDMVCRFYEGLTGRQVRIARTRRS